MSEFIAVADINLSGGTQSRAKIEQDVVNDYRDALQGGAEFPPVVIYHDGSILWLADGFHRVHAYFMRRLVHIPADVRQGNRRDAILYSVGANAKHGLPRTGEDKRRAVLKLLDDEEWANWSDNRIARAAGVSPTTVGSIRKPLSKLDSEARTYTTKHGTTATMRTSAIGRPASGMTTGLRAANDDEPQSGALAAVPRQAVIGDATIYLGDCRDILPTLDSVSHILTDPPYEAAAHGSGRMTQASIRDGVDATLNFPAITEELRTFAAKQAARLSTGWAIYFCQAEGVYLWQQAIEQAGAKYRSPMVWVKPDGSPNFAGNGPAPCFEMLVTSWCGAGNSVWNGRGQRGVYTHAVNADRDKRHQTVKPLPLLEELLLAFTKPGEVILDPFMGIGSLGVACLKLGRKYIGIEMDQTYFDVARERISGAVPYSQTAAA